MMVGIQCITCCSGFARDRCTIAFQGGEPTLAGLDFYQQCIRLEKEYNTKKIPVSYALQTNGKFSRSHSRQSYKKIAEGLNKVTVQTNVCTC